jgi:hypothetical protein
VKAVDELEGAGNRKCDDEECDLSRADTAVQEGHADRRTKARAALPECDIRVSPRRDAARLSALTRPWATGRALRRPASREPAAWAAGPVLLDRLRSRETVDLAVTRPHRPPASDSVQRAVNFFAIEFMLIAKQRRIIRMALDSLLEALAPLGFVRGSEQIAVRSLDADTLGWLGLNMGTAPSTNVNPVVGVRNQRVERLLATLLNEPYDDVIPPTVAGNIGYVGATNFLSFEFTNTAEMSDVSSRVAREVSLRGVPFMEENRSLARLGETLANPTFNIMPDHAAYRRPLVLHLSGRSDEASNIVKDWETRLGERRDLAAERYRRFAQAFRSSCLEVAKTS